MDALQLIEKAQRLGIIPSVHGDGFIQVNLPWIGRRLHGWGHPGIPDQRDPLKVHDHRFYLRSTVLVGDGIENTTYWLRKSSGFSGDVHVYEVRRVNPTVRNQGPPYEYPVLRDDRRFRLEEWRTQTVLQGETYEHPPGLLHHTRPLGRAITLVEKIFADDGYTPRVIFSADRPPRIDVRRDVLAPRDAYRILREICAHELVAA